MGKPSGRWGSGCGAGCPSSHKDIIMFICREGAGGREGEITGQLRIEMINGKVTAKQIPLNSKLWRISVIYLSFMERLSVDWKRSGQISCLDIILINS